MASKDDDDATLDQKARIEKLKEKINEISGGEMKSMEAEDIPPDIAEQFWEQVLEFESAPWMSNFQRLQESGWEPPSPDEMDDQTLTLKLWEMIEKLAELRVFIHATNHLSDRELYSHLWNDALREESPRMPMSEDAAWNLDLVSSGSEEDIYLWLKFYADEETRNQWKSDWPDYELPAHENPPYNRDAFMPQPTYGVRDDNDDEPEMMM